MPPVLIIAFLRLEGLKRVVNALIDSNVSRIYIAVDGPRNSEEVDLSRNLVEYVDSLDIEGVEFYSWVRETNLGVAVSVISAVDWFFQFEDQGVVIEDDLDFEDSFIKFAAMGLKEYRDVENVVMLSGNYYGAQEGNKVHFARYPQIWGWATWANSWKRIRKEIPSMDFSKESINFNKRDAFWNIGVTRVKFGILDTWDLPLAALMRRNGWLCCIPPLNLVTNLGNDEFSTHTLESEFPMRFPTSRRIQAHEIVFEEHQIVDSAYEKFLEQEVFKIKNKHLLLFLKQAALKIRNRVNKRDSALSINVRFEKVRVPSYRSQSH